LLGPLAGAADGTLQSLACRFVQEAGGVIAARSAAVYEGPWRSFVEWWIERKLPGTVYDTPPVVVGLYLFSVYTSAAADAVGEGRVRQASGAIHHHFTAVGAPSPSSHSVCQAVRRLAAKHLVPRPVVRDALSLADLQSLAEHFAPPGAGLLSLMMCAAISLMFFGFLRFDELAEVGVHQDLLVVTESHLEVFIPRSKTDQLWKGAWVAVGGIGGPACPVRLVTRLLEQGEYRRQPQAAEEDVGPLLRTVQHTAAGGRLQRVTGSLQAPVRSMSYEAFRARLAAMCAEVGINKRITPHSMRIGGNSAAAEAGVPVELRMAHGRWLSPQMVGLYTRRTVDSAIGLTRQMGLH
jgi:hypothetical protein